MKKTLIAFILLCTIFAGCAGQVVQMPKTKKQYQSYILNEVQKVSVGDPIIEVENANIKDAYEVMFDYQTPTLGITGKQQVFLRKGDRFTAVAFVPDDLNAILIREEGAEPQTLLIHIYPDGRINRGWCLSDGTVPIQGKWTTDQLFIKSEVPSRVEDSFRSQIIYSGIIENTIKAAYREFFDDYARPAFSQDLQYNLDESNIISYIEIIKATNSYIEFKVLEDGGLPWLPK